MIIKIQIRINSDSQQFYIIFTYNLQFALTKRVTSLWPIVERDLPQINLFMPIMVYINIVFLLAIVLSVLLRNTDCGIPLVSSISFD